MKVKYIESSDERAFDFNNLVCKKYSNILKTRKPELILIAGGDGAMMHAIKRYHHLNIPFFGIAKGTFNFLMNDIRDEEKFLKKLLDGKIKINLQKAQTLEVIHKREEKETKLGYAANDILLGSSISGYHTFKLTSKDKTLDSLEVKGTGLCISTDLGSTAYSYNLGNPAIPLNKNLLMISGIVCNKDINDILKIQNIKIKIISNRENCSVFLDGIKQKILLKGNDAVVLKKGKTVKIGFVSLKKFQEKRRNISNRHRNF